MFPLLARPGIERTKVISTAVTDPRLASAMLDIDAVRQAEQLVAVDLLEDDSGVLSVRLRPDSLDQPDHRPTTRATGRG